VQGASHEFLTGTGFAKNQYGSLGRRNLVHPVADFAHPRALADHALDGIGLVDFILQGLSATPLAIFPQYPVHEYEQFIMVEGLGYVVGCPQFDGLDG